MAGNAFSAVLLLKGDLSKEERGGAELLSGPDGEALRKALNSLGYAPEDWACVSTVGPDGKKPLDPSLVRLAVTTLDPDTLVACDEPAAHAIREAYAEELADVPDFDEAMLTPGKMVRILGMRVMNLGGFAASLSDPHAKQLMWARLKRVPPLGEPF